MRLPQASFRCSGTHFHYFTTILLNIAYLFNMQYFDEGPCCERRCITLTLAEKIFIALQSMTKTFLKKNTLDHADVNECTLGGSILFSCTKSNFK